MFMHTGPISSEAKSPAFSVEAHVVQAQHELGDNWA